ncbi:hypothetical protein SNEBB_011410 [Seison nebaliae]|nr:hypothetical protein SNEBB_011410 [Seison nebaliae]
MKLKFNGIGSDESTSSSAIISHLPNDDDDERMINENCPLIYGNHSGRINEEDEDRSVTSSDDYLLSYSTGYGTNYSSNDSHRHSHREENMNKQKSFVTIFAIWNTMMGTSLLNMPWAIDQAGLVLGVIIILTMCAICFYTCTLILESRNAVHIPGTSIIEFTDICKYYFGRTGELASLAFSLLSILGGAIVYWILMSNFLYTLVTYMYTSIEHGSNSTDIYPPINHFNLHYLTDNSSGVICPSHPINSLWKETGKDVWFYRLWDREKTCPLYLVALLFPLISLQNPSFFLKFNAVGIVSIGYLVIFVIVKGVGWGFQLQTTDIRVVYANYKFPSLTGILLLAYFIHACILTIVRNQEKPQNNKRDLGIAYILVCLTYLTIGIVFYITFPLTHNCIEDNLLNNFYTSDVLATIGRVVFLFQMISVYPLIVYIMRVQTMHLMFNDIYPNHRSIIAFNIIIVAICVTFARFIPHIGLVIRYFGSFCGLVYVFSLPILVHLTIKRLQNNSNQIIMIAGMQLTKLDNIKKLSSRIERVLGQNPSAMTLQGTNTYLVGKNEKKILIDCGDENVSKYTDLLTDYLQRKKYTISDIIVTHHHHDHEGGVGDLFKKLFPLSSRKSSDIPSSSTDKQIFNNNRHIPNVYKLPYESSYKKKNLEKFYKDVEHNQLFKVDDETTLKVVQTPGHCDDHISLQLVEENALFSGDCMLGDKQTTVFVNLTQYMDSLEKLLSLKPSIIYPGHGDIIEKPVDEIRRYIDHRKLRNKQILESLKNTPNSDISTIRQFVYPGLEPTLENAAESNIKNHLEWLKDMDKVMEITPDKFSLKKSE